MSAAQADAAMAETGMLKWLVFALLITFAQAIGVLMVIHKAGAKRLPACLSTTFWLLVTMVAPLLAYACIYSGYSLTGYLVDLGHHVVGFMAMAAVYAAFRGKGKIDETELL